MLVLLRWIGRLFKKEYRFLSRYERSHPHFFLYVGFDALISVLLVVGGFQLYSHLNSSSPSRVLLERSGGVEMTVGKLLDQVRVAGIPVYWLGPLTGATYSLNRSLKSVTVVTYIPKGSSIRYVSQPRLVVETYTSRAALDENDRVIASASSRKVARGVGFTVEYDVKSLTSMTVSPTGVKQIVVVEYPNKQSESKLLQDAQRLSLVS